MPNEPIDAEVVQPPPMAMTTTRQNMAVGQAMAVEDIIAQVNLIQNVMRRVMQDGEHYGTIPGCGDKKTLLQPGAQKLTMTFRLAPEYQIQETNFDRGHKEYRVICTLKSIQSGNFVGQGVGCCSTLESKYRYRGGNRKCPECGAEAIIKGKDFKNPNGPGEWVCWRKKKGCGKTWPLGTASIESQSEEKVENENPADCYNTVLKIAKKRSFVDATITATAASDIFTQDIGDNEEDPTQNAPAPPGRAPTSQPATQAQKAPQNQQSASPRQQNASPGEQKGVSTPQNAPSAAQNAQRTPQNAPAAPQKPKFPTQKSLEYMITSLKAGPGADLRRISTEYFRKLGQLMPNEEIEELPLRFVPVSKTEIGKLASCIAQFEVGDPIQKAFEPHGEAPASSSHSKAASPGAPESPQAAAAPSPSVPAQEPLPLSQQPAKPIEVPRDNPKDPKGYPDDSPYWKVICPVPRKGMLRPEYLKDPDTIGSMYVAMKNGDQEAQRRLFGFASHFELKGWIKADGTEMPPSAADIEFRRGLDEFLKEHGDGNRAEEEDDVPF